MNIVVDSKDCKGFDFDYPIDHDPIDYSDIFLNVFDIFTSWSQLVLFGSWF